MMKSNNHLKMVLVRLDGGSRKCLQVFGRKPLFFSYVEPISLCGLALRPLLGSSERREQPAVVMATHEVPAPRSTAAFSSIARLWRYSSASGTSVYLKLVFLALSSFTRTSPTSTGVARKNSRRALTAFCLFYT